MARWRRRLVAATAAGAAALAIAPAAAQAIGVQSLTTSPSSTQAGGHPNFTLSLRFSGGDAPKSLRIDLPAGLVGNPNAATKCPQATFRAGGCTAASAVGTTTVYTDVGLAGGAGGGGLPSLPGAGSPGGVLCQLGICDSGGTLLGTATNTAGGLLSTATGGLLRAAPRRRTRAHAAATGSTVPITAPGTVYVLEPDPGEPALLGIEVTPAGGLIGTIRLESKVSVRDDSDFGLTSTLDDLPQTFNGLSTTITGMDLTLNGAASAGPFVTLPTSCSTATTKVSVTAYGGSSDSGSASFTPTGCQNVPFNPGLSVVPETARVDSTSGYTIHLGLPSDETPIHQAHVSNVKVVLPKGTALNPGVAAGLDVCTDAQFGKGSRSDPSCPAASKVGTVAFTSPLVGTLTGTVYEGAPTPSQMLRIFVDVPGPGLRIKLVGNVDPDPKTGQVTSTFSNLPQLPFTAFALSFRGGPDAILVTPPACGPAISSAVITPYSGTAAATPSSQFNVSYDGQGQPCPSPMPFNPQIAATVKPSTAGASTSMTTTITRGDRQQRLGDMALSFPAGLLGGLGSGIGLCELDKAKAGNCPANSRVGTATLQAGPGTQPLTISGSVYLTTPIDGSLAGMAIVVPGKVGPFTLPDTVSLARIAVRPTDSGLEVTAKDLPQILAGIPLDIRQIRLSLDRPGFMRNATSCAQMQLAATFTSADGQTAKANAPYQATDCGSVPFKPVLAGTINGEISKGGHPAVSAVVSQGPGEISARKVTVTLPPEIGADITRLTKSCPEGQDCGDRNTIGTATAVTPLLPIPLTGPVKLVTPKGGGLPVLELHLSGLLSISLTGHTKLSPTGEVINTFDGIPDVPLSQFELALKGGKDGILLATKDMHCGEVLEGKGEFVGYSGAVHKTVGRFKACGTIKVGAKSRRGRKHHHRKAAKASARFHHGALTVKVKGRKAVKRLSIALPRHARVKGRRGVEVRAHHARKAKVRAHKRTVKVTRLKARKVTVKVGRHAIKGAKALKRKRAHITVRVAMRHGKHAKLRVRVRH